MGRLYNEVIPTVLIDQSTEHIDYGLLLYYGVNEVFNLPKDKKVLTGKERVAYISKLKNLYYEMYGHGNVLYKVSANVLGQL